MRIATAQCLVVLFVASCSGSDLEPSDPALLQLPLTLVAQGTITTGTAVPKLENGLNVLQPTLVPSSTVPGVTAVRVQFATPLDRVLVNVTPDSYDPAYGFEVWTIESSDHVEFMLTDAARKPVNPATSLMRWSFSVPRPWHH
jgi:hypothetical protein